MRDARIFCMAGLWGKWIRPHREGELGIDDQDHVSGLGVSASQLVETFTIITTGPNPMVAAVYDRMSYPA